jgi:branched-chain amino acid aminotransferase
MSLVWLNGTIQTANAARIDPADRGFTLGDGLFETFRATGGATLHADRHFARLRQGAEVLRIPMPFSDHEMAAALSDVLRANGVSDAALRLTLTRGPAARGVLPGANALPTMLISAGPLPDAVFAARLIVAQRTRRNENSRLSRIKSLNYLDSIMARQEALDAGADDALLVNTQGNLAEATAANVFLFIDGAWITPKVSEGALPGVVRGLLLESGAAQEATISQLDWERAEAGLLTNSLGTRPIARIGRQCLDASRTLEGSASF